MIRCGFKALSIAEGVKGKGLSRVQQGESIKRPERATA